MRRECSSSQNRKAGHTHTHSHTHSHTGRLLYPRYSPAAARVMTGITIQRSLRLKLDKYQNIAIALSFDSVSVLSILFLTILYKGG